MAESYRRPLKRRVLASLRSIPTKTIEIMKLVKNRVGRVATLVIALAALAAVVAGCGGSSSASSGGKGALVAYPTRQKAYAALIPAFQKTSAGKGVSFSQSFGASGDQARAVTSGLPADV